MAGVFITSLQDGTEAVSAAHICAPPNCLLDENKNGPLVEFMYLVFTRMPGESHCR